MNLAGSEAFRCFDTPMRRKSNMIIFTTTITTTERDHAAVVASLQRLVEPTRVASGCDGCELCCRSDDSHRLTLTERWTNEEALKRRIRSADFRTILAAVDASSERPTVRLEWNERIEGLDYVARVLEEKPD